MREFGSLERRRRRKLLEKVSSARKFLSVYSRIPGVDHVEVSDDELINLAHKIFGRKRGSRMWNRLLANHQEEDALRILLKRTKSKAHEILRNHPMVYLCEMGGWAEEKYEELTED